VNDTLTLRRASSSTRSSQPTRAVGHRTRAPRSLLRTVVGRSSRVSKIFSQVVHSLTIADFIVSAGGFGAVEKKKLVTDMSDCNEHGVCTVPTVNGSALPGALPEFEFGDAVVL